MHNELLDGFYLHDVRIEPLTGRVDGIEGEKHLSSMGVEVLLWLAKHPRMLVSREDIIDKVWGKGHGSAEALNHAVGEIRRVLGDHAGDPQFIQTVPKRGYRLLVAPRMDLNPDPQGHTSEREPSFWRALVRHGVVQAVIAYLLIGWVLIQVSGETFIDLGFAEWSPRFVTFVVVGGIPVVCLLSWFLELTGGHIVSDQGKQSGGLWSGLERNYPAIAAAYVIATFGVGIYQYSVGIEAPPGDSEQPDDLIPISLNSVAVLKMANLDGSDVTDVFTKGLSEDILNRVARVPGLLVPSRGDTWSLPENPTSELVRHRLRVAFYLEGSVRIEDEQITVVAQFIDSSNGLHIFSLPFVVEVARFSDIQSELTSLIVSHMQVSLPEDLQATILPPPDETNLDAYIQYRRGKDILDSPHTLESIDRGADYYRRALEIDPAYAAAHAGLCITYTARYQLAGTTEDILAAEQSCGSALAAAPHLPLIHRSTANLFFLTGRLSNAETAYEAALEIYDRDAEAMLGLARVYSRQQRNEDAKSLTLQAIELQPGNWRAFNRLGAIQFALGEYDAAASSYNKAIYLFPDNFVTIGNMATAKMMAGDFPGARDDFEQSLDIQMDPVYLSNLGIMYYYLGEFDKSAEIHRRSVDMVPNLESNWINLADALYFANRKEQALAAFREATTLAGERLETDPTDGETLTYAAWAETMTGNVDKGIELADRAIEVAPDDPYSYYYRALVALQADDEKTAIVAVKRAIDLGYPLIMLKAEPYFESLRRHSELPELGS